MNRDAIEFDRIAESRAFFFPDKVNDVVGRDNCRTSLCRDIEGVADLVEMPRRLTVISWSNRKDE